MARYHMNKAEREIADRAELTGILHGGKYATIALCRDNEPYVVTLSCGYDPARHALYFHTANRGLKLDYVRANPAACATVIEDGGYVADRCAHRFRSVVLWGRMAIVSAPEERRHGLEILAKQLESDVPARLGKIDGMADADWERVAILRLDIGEMTGKKGS